MQVDFQIKKFIIASIIVLMVLGTCTWLFFNRSFTPVIPKPTGKFNVGTTILHLIDRSRSEPHEEKNSNFREFIARIYYPTQISEGHRSPYVDLPTLAILKENLSKMAHIPLEQFDYLNSFKSHSFENAPIALDQQSYPILIFSPGWGAPTNVYSSLLEDLASHGYVVIGINYPYITDPVVFPHGKIVRGIKQPQDPQEKKAISIKEMETWIQDIRFVIDELSKINLHENSNNIFKNKLDTKRIGIFGHSFGGSVAVEVCKNDHRCIAGADIEGKLYSNSPLTKPFMFIVAPHAQEVLQPIKDLSNESKNIRYVELDGVNHGSFTDFYLIAPFKKDALPTLDVIQGIHITRKLLLDFFNNYL